VVDSGFGVPRLSLLFSAHETHEMTPKEKGELIYKEESYAIIAEGT